MFWSISVNKLFLCGWAGVLVLAAAAAPQLSSAAGASSGTAAQVSKGRAVFASRCAVCHSINGGGGKMGPDLTGVVGRQAGSTAFAYSPALKKLGKSWSPELLNAFLSRPAQVAPGTRMVTTLPQPSDRAAIVAYLANSRR